MIVVQCSCGRKLRAPDQMEGQAAHCVCGKSVPLISDDTDDELDEVEPDFGRPDQNSLPAPKLVRPAPSAKKVGKSVFRKVQGENVETGDSPPPPPASPKKKKKRRRDKSTSAERKRRRVQDTFFTGVLRSLKFPFRTESLITIALMAVAYGLFTPVAGFMKFGILGFKAAVLMGLGTLMILGYFLYFLMQIFRLAVSDEDDLPLTLDFDMDQILQDVWLWGSCLWWCGMPYLAYTLTLGHSDDWIYRLSILGFCGFLMPMALMSTALHLSAWDANPLLTGRAICLTIGDYLGTTLIYGSLLVGIGYAGWLAPSFPETIPVVTHIGIWIFMFYGLVAAAYGYGNFYYRNRARLAWFGELPRQI